jgi:hypothetical protein
MTIEPEAMRAFRTQPYAFQLTITRPLERLDEFIDGLLSNHLVESAVICTDQIVFKPEHVIDMANASDFELPDCWDFKLSINSKKYVLSWLNACLRDWIDFLFYCNDSDLAIYADHDEFITIYLSSSAQFIKTLNYCNENQFVVHENYRRILEECGFRNQWLTDGS